MGARDRVQMTITRADAILVARWLSGFAIPASERRQDTILTPGLNAEITQGLRELAVILEKAAGRKRGSETFSPLIPRTALSAMEAAVSRHLPLIPSYPISLFTLADGIKRIAEEMRKAGTRKRGRPKLCDAERDERIAREHVVEDRHRKRLKRRRREDDAWSAYFKEVSTRGETVLTTSIPSPKI